MSSPLDLSAAPLVILALTAVALLIALIALRPELWARLFLTHIDPRPLGLMRIAFGIVVLWTFLDLLLDVRTLLTDEGMWPTSMARARWGGPLAYDYDPVHGFEHWWSPLSAALGLPTVLHLRSDPPFVFGVYGLLLISLVLMTLGVWTRWATFAGWLLAEQLYRYNGVFYTGGDFVIRAFFFLGMLSQWGEAYSVDAWWRRQRVLLGGASEMPALKKIPAWPQRLMMVQLACIYTVTGMMKNGTTWHDGTALYYALSLDHFSRVPASNVVVWLHQVGVLPLFTWLTRWWEMLFPVALIGAALRGYEDDRAAGVWPRVDVRRRRLSHVLGGALSVITAVIIGTLVHRATTVGPASAPVTSVAARTVSLAAVGAAPLVLVALYQWVRRRWPAGLRFTLDWILGKRVWLLFGILVHSIIDLTMNVGTFSQAIVVPYLCWLSASEVEGFWRYLLSRPLRVGEGGRPHRTGLARLVLSPVDRIRYRAPGCSYAIHYHPDELAVRRSALLRLWDLGHRLRFIANDDVTPGTLRLEIEGRPRALESAPAAAALTRVLPGLWWLRPPASVPITKHWAGYLALRILGQA